MGDKNQKMFSEFQVPDSIRIRKGIKLLGERIKNLEAVLDIGLAKGGFGDVLANDYGIKTYGIDLHKRNIPNVKFRKCDVNDRIPFRDGQFDLITAGEIIEHTFDDMKFLGECNRVLKKNGLLLLTTPNMNFFVNRFRIMMGQMPLFVYMQCHYNMYNKDELKRKLEESGFRVLNVKSSHVLFSTRRNSIGKIFEKLGDLFPTFGAHLILLAQKKVGKS